MNGRNGMSTTDKQNEPITAAANLPRDLTLIKMENESIMALAAAHKRDHAAIREELIEQLEAYPAFARVAVYTKPVGTVQVVDCQCGARYEETGRSIGDCPRCGKIAPKGRPTMKKKFARGLSIRAAEAIAEVYGFNRIRVDVQEIDANTVRIEATFVDLAKGRTYSDAGILSKFYRARSGETQRIPDDRFYNVVVKAEASKRVREVITRCVPPGLRAELLEIAEQRMKASLGAESIDKIVSAFAEFRIGREELERVVGRSVGAGWTEEDRFTLLTLFNALKTQETTREEILEGLETTVPAKRQRLSTLDALVASSTDQDDQDEQDTDTISEQPTAAAQATAPPQIEAPQTVAQSSNDQATAQTRRKPRKRPEPASEPHVAPAPQTDDPQDVTLMAPEWAAEEIAALETIDAIEEYRKDKARECGNPNEWVGFMQLCDNRKKQLA